MTAFFSNTHLRGVLLPGIASFQSQNRNRPAWHRSSRFAVFEVLKKDNYTGPVSLYVEHLPQAGIEKNLADINRDFAYQPVEKPRFLLGFPDCPLGAKLRHGVFLWFVF